MTPHQALEHLVNRAIEGKLVPGEAETLRMLVRDFQPRHESGMMALYEQWLKEGTPPLGTSINRFWDKKLIEFGRALGLHQSHEVPTQQPAREE